MNTITPAGTFTPAPASSVDLELFKRFIAYIDRGEQTTKSYLNNFKQFLAYLRYNEIQQPTRPDIIAYRDHLLTEHAAIILDPGTPEGWSFRLDGAGHPVMIKCKAATVRAYLQAVKAFFSWTAAEGLYPNIAANVHTPKLETGHKKDALTPSDVRTIEGSITAAAANKTRSARKAAKDSKGRAERSAEQGKRLYAMFLLAVNAGLRTIEISRANVEDLELTRGRAYLYIWGKGHAEADTRKALAPEVYRAIKDYLDTRSNRPTPGSPLFVSTGNRSGGCRISPGTISAMLKEALQAAGYDSPRLTAHSLRHTAGQNVLTLTGSNIYKTQLYMRHASPVTTEIYLDGQKAEEDSDIAEGLYKLYHSGAV